MTEKEFKDLKKEFCDYETCVALKELGFREKCLTYYDAPTIYQAQKWLREKMGILLDPRYLELIDDWICVISYKNISRRSSSTNGMGGYEESLAEGIKKIVATLKDSL